MTVTNEYYEEFGWDRPHIAVGLAASITGLRNVWSLTDEVHGRFEELNIPYKLIYEIDWWVEVPDEQAVLAKLSIGEGNPN